MTPGLPPLAREWVLSFLCWGIVAGALGAGGAGARVTCAYLAATPAVAGLEKGDYVAAVRGMMPALTVLDGDDVPAGVGGGG